MASLMVLCIQYAFCAVGTGKEAGDGPSSSSFMLSPELELELELIPELKESPSPSLAAPGTGIDDGVGIGMGIGAVQTRTFCTVATWFRFGWNTRVVIRAQGIGWAGGNDSGPLAGAAVGPEAERPG